MSNRGVLPSDYYALPEQQIRGPVPDVLALRLSHRAEPPSKNSTAVAVAVNPPRARLVQISDRSLYSKKTNRVAVRHRHGQIVAVIEIVSPGNQSSNSEFLAFISKIADLIQQGVYVLVIDVFPPTKRDPQGIHKAIWEEFEDEFGMPPSDKPLTLAAYSAGEINTAYVESFAVCEELPVMPLFLESDLYVPVALEETYRMAWAEIPDGLKELLEPGECP